MLSAGHVADAYKAAIKYALETTTLGKSNSVSRFNSSVCTFFGRELRKYDGSVYCTLIKQEDPIGKCCVIKPIDNELCYMSMLPFLSQLTYYDNGEIKMRMAYNHASDVLVYDFGKEIFEKGKYAGVRLDTKRKSLNSIVEVPDVNNKNVLNYILYKDYCDTKLVSYGSDGTAMLNILRRRANAVLIYGLDFDLYSEIIDMSIRSGVSYSSVNGVYEFSFH